MQAILHPCKLNLTPLGQGLVGRTEIELRRIELGGRVHAEQTPGSLAARQGRRRPAQTAGKGNYAIHAQSRTDCRIVALYISDLPMMSLR